MDVWSKNIDLALNKKMVAIFFGFVSGGKQESRVKAVLCKCDIYKPQEIDRCGKFRRKRGKAGQKL